MICSAPVGGEDGQIIAALGGYTLSRIPDSGGSPTVLLDLTKESALLLVSGGGLGPSESAACRPRHSFRLNFLLYRHRSRPQPNYTGWILINFQVEMSRKAALI
jgi:hypothetical protein